MAERPVPNARVMMRDVEGDSGSDVPLRFAAGGEELFGILTEPRGTPRGVGIVFLNGMWDRNRFSLRLGRRLASLGFHTLRFDYQGVGESTGTMKKWSLDRPFTQDLLGAVDELGRRGVEQIILVGRCFGARTALSAVTRIPTLRGMTFISLPLHDAREQGPGSRWAHDRVQEFVRRGVRPWVVLRAFGRTRRQRYLRLLQRWLKHSWQGFRPQGGNGQNKPLEWVSEEVVEFLRAAVDRCLPLLFLYGTADNQYRDFRQAQSGVIGALLAEAGDRIQVRILDGPVHNLTSLRTQETVLEYIQGWVESVGSTRLMPAGTQGRSDGVTGVRTPGESFSHGS